MPNSALTGGTKPPIYYGYVIVIAIFFIMALAFGTNFAFGVFFIPVQTEFSWTRAMTSGAFSLCMLMQGIMGIVMGGLTDKFGPRLVMTASAILLGIGYVLMSQINALWQLYLYYGVIIGIGMSSGYVTLLSTTARWFNKRRNLMTGVVLAGMSLGTLIAPPISQMLIEKFDWSTSYLITAAAVFVIVIIAGQFLKRDPSRVGQMTDGLKSETSIQKDIDKTGIDFKEVVKSRPFWLFVGAEMCFGAILFSILVHIVPHATAITNSGSLAAIILSTIGGFSIVGRIVQGNVADRIGNKKVLLFGFIILALVMLWAAFMEITWALFVFAAIFGFMYVGIETSESPMTAWLFGLKAHGLVFGVVSFTFTIGASVGPLMMGYLYDITGEYRSAFLILAALSAGGFVFTLFLNPKNKAKS